MAASGQTLIGTSNAALAASGTKTTHEIAAGSASLIRINRVRVSQITHKTSEQYTLQGQRITTTGTGTSTTPLQDEPQSAALGAARIGTCKTADSVEPTYTASTIVLQPGWNSLTGRDIVNPPGKELYISPSAILGLACVTPASTTNFSPVTEAFFEVLG